jgi:DNA-binding NarL/FixJ family response regulator
MATLTTDQARRTLLTDPPDGCPFSVSEFACVQLLARGLSLVDIAGARGVSRTTIRTHLSTARAKMGVRTGTAPGAAVRARRELLTGALQAGWIGEIVDKTVVPGIEAVRLQRFRERRSTARTLAGASPARGQRMPGAALSTKELGVMRLLAGGMTRRDVAVKLHMRLGSMSVLLQSVFDALGAHSIFEAIEACRVDGLLEPLVPESDLNVVRFRPAENCPLSPRELGVLAQGANGRNPADSGEQLGMSAHSVRNSLSDAYRRLHVTSLGQALAACYAHGWLDTDLARSEQSCQDEKVTWAQRLYLEAWDQGRTARSDEEHARSQRMRADALAGVMREANVDLPDRPRAVAPIVDSVLEHMLTLPEAES